MCGGKNIPTLNRLKWLQKNHHLCALVLRLPQLVASTNLGNVKVVLNATTKFSRLGCGRGPASGR